jgi:hypothetical protein
VGEAAPYEAKLKARAAPAGPAGFGAPPPLPMAMAAPAMVSPERLREARAQSVPVQTRTAEVGDLFQYEISNAVTVKRNQSALVPILQRPFAGQRVAVYNREVRERNPLGAVLLKNTTGVTLEGGAVTVFEGEAYVGESMLETLKPDEERLLPFSVELGVVVSIDHESRLEEVHFARVVRGALHLFRYRVQKTIYNLRSKLDRVTALYLEHPFRKGWKLVETPRPAESTESFLRFRLDVPPRETTRFVVTERGDESESVGIRNVSRDTVALWTQQRYLDDATRASFDRLLELNDRAARLGFWIAQREEETQKIFADQKRLRENLEALGASPDEKALRDRYVAELTREEDRLAAIRAELDTWRREKDEVEQQGNDLVRGLTFERTV